MQKEKSCGVKDDPIRLWLRWLDLYLQPIPVYCWTVDLHLIDSLLACATRGLGGPDCNQLEPSTFENLVGTQIPEFYLDRWLGVQKFHIDKLGDIT